MGMRTLLTVDGIDLDEVCCDSQMLFDNVRLAHYERDVRGRARELFPSVYLEARQQAEA